MTKEQKKGLLIIFSSASGGGKTTIARKIAEKDPRFVISVSYTTRKIRKGEQEGRDYFFVDEDTFERMIREHKFLEWEKVHDAFYGTSNDFVQKNLDLGRDVILVIDVKGARNIKQKYPESVSFFFKAPSEDELKNRLRKRGTESEESFAKRLEMADWEEQQAKDYDYHVVNDKLEDTIDRVLDLIEKERKKRIQ